MKNCFTLKPIGLCVLSLLASLANVYADSDGTNCEPQTQNSEQNTSVENILDIELQRVMKGELSYSFCTRDGSCSYDQINEQVEKKFDESAEDQLFVEGLKKSLREKNILSDESSAFVIRSKTEEKSEPADGAWVYTYDGIEMEVVRHNLESGERQSVEIDVGAENLGNFDFSKDAKKLEVYDQETGEIKKSFSLDEAFADLNAPESSEPKASSNTPSSTRNSSEDANQGPLQKVDISPTVGSLGDTGMGFQYTDKSKPEGDKAKFFKVNEFTSRVKLRQSGDEASEQKIKDTAYISADGKNLYRIHNKTFEHYQGVSQSIASTSDSTTTTGVSLASTRRARSSSDRLQLGDPKTGGQVSFDSMSYTDSAVAAMSEAYDRAIQSLPSNSLINDQFISEFAKNFQPPQITENSSDTFQDEASTDQGLEAYQPEEKTVSNQKNDPKTSAHKMSERDSSTVVEKALDNQKSKTTDQTSSNSSVSSQNKHKDHDSTKISSLPFLGLVPPERKLKILSKK